MKKHQQKWVQEAYCSRFGKASNMGSTSTASRPENTNDIHKMNETFQVYQVFEASE